ncbi:DNA mismatch repair endonuclease MutL [Paenibacillus sacheonensis]|uniref:DNA mismatch repair protein MutL n=1 Tax=Paenibacillus sacheonensis TaxID=742054 RepID=A0A7X5BX64_9BACL|nr:DNA mismatch repair endonuclease MutL [Paenibacillus sacheonensis]MBM7563389.1 DNA mismatch repair protein MutL [Paenibacillus sacheonensis]NBC68056.1 DNA mismatch repair endonuclease MutL [Paenibacillus sacheonensis]
MSKIRILDEQLANQIAAGEVVERPSSVVKELVENAVDAGSSAIDIVIEEGGLTLIRVTDNGSGIEGDDIHTAFYRHATSKISSSKDLFRIASLGFRGEALPSIAAVAKVECLSAPDGSGLGRKLVIEGGTIIANEETNAPQGTDISVRELFYNTPARLKYMKTIQTELGHIADYVNRLALAHPGIAFTLKHNGSTLLRTLGSGDRLQTFAAIYGTATAKAMLPVEGEHPDYELRGIISKPEQTRSNRNGITIVVNGRYIRSFVLNQAMMQAYHTLLPINRFPLAVLELGMHPSLLDVNVHPSKMEVRFSKEAELREFIEDAIRRALGKQRHIPGPAAPAERSKPAFIQDRISFHQPEPEASAYGASMTPPVPPRDDQTVLGSSDPSRPATGPSSAGQSMTGSPAAGKAPSAARPASAQAISPLEVAAALEKAEQSFGIRAADKPWAPAPARGSSQAPWAGSEKTKPSIPRDATERLYSPPAAQRDPWRAQESPAAGSGYAASDAAFDAASDAATATGHSAEIARPSSSAERRDATDMDDPARSIDRTRFNDQGAAVASPAASYESVSEAEPSAAAHPAFPELYWIGQLHGTYIVAQNEEGLFLIDQHAAHERIHYEYFLAKFGRPEQASQQLLVPLTLEFTAAEAGALRGKLHLLQEAGVELEPFGANTFLVRSYPEWLPAGQEGDVIGEMTDWLLQERGAVDVGKLREKSAIMCACKASIKANDRLTREEGEGLLRRLAACAMPYTCPHGRPIVVHMTTYQLEKMFKRVMS